MNLLSLPKPNLTNRLVYWKPYDVPVKCIKDEGRHVLVKGVLQGQVIEQIINRKEIETNANKSTKK